jgi:hypothetical protein
VTDAPIDSVLDGDALTSAACAGLLAADWSELQAFADEDLLRRPDRSMLALMQIALHLQSDDLDRAGQALAKAESWGVDRQLTRRVVLAGVHIDLARAVELQGDVSRRQAHLSRARELLARVGSPGASEPGSGSARPAAAVMSLQGYAAEVRRQREVIQALRKTIHTMRAAAGGGTPDAELIARILAAKLTYLSQSKLACIAATCRAIDQQCVPGTFIEAGCALGGSAILISAVKSAERQLEVYDVFGMIPPPGDQDTDDVHARYREIVEGRSAGIEGDTYYGYQTDLERIVVQNFTRFGINPEASRVKLIKGLVQDTMTGGERVAFAHLDLDWYEPVWFCLQQIYPRMSVGGSIILDDYHDWGGCRRAADEFLVQVAGSCKTDDTARSMKITKIAEEVRG